MGRSGTPSDTWFRGPTGVQIPNGISIGSAVLHSLLHRVAILYNRLPLFPQNCPFPWGSEPLSNTWFPGPTRIRNPNGISIGSAVFAGLTTVTDRPTDHATRSVATIGCASACVVLRCGPATANAPIIPIRRHTHKSDCAANRLTSYRVNLISLTHTPRRCGYNPSSASSRRESRHRPKRLGAIRSFSVVGWIV